MHISQFGGVLVDPWVSVLVRTYIRLSTEYGYYGVQSISNTTPCNIIMYFHLLYLLYLYPTLSKAHADDESSSIRTFLVCTSSWPPGILVS